MTIAAISEPMPANGQPSSTDTMRLVFLTDSATAATSNGRSERKSITSAEIPAFSNSSAACRASFTMREKAVIVTCSPARAIRALPIGTRYSGSSGTAKLSP